MTDGDVETIPADQGEMENNAAAEEEALLATLAEDAARAEGQDSGDDNDDNDDNDNDDDDDDDDEETQKRKRRSRWGTDAEGRPVEENPDAAAEQVKKKRRSRWGDEEEKLYVPKVSTIPKGLTKEQTEIYLLRMGVDEISRKLRDGRLYDPNDPNLSPSPEPIYDKMGKRINTREAREREKLINQRARLIREAQQLDPNYRPPADVKVTREKFVERVPIPIDDYPGYNFIGLVIGPRGNTQKRLERETGCKIAVRGKGSQKEGRRGASHRSTPEDDGPLHVLVTGDEKEKVKAAAKRITDLLVPIDDDLNEHKKAQLRELAAINGTLREDEMRLLDELKNDGLTYSRPDLRCEICGDASHPTSDCPQRNMSKEDRQKMDEEYKSFMAELGVGGAADSAGMDGGFLTAGPGGAASGANAGDAPQGGNAREAANAPDRAPHPEGSDRAGGAYRQNTIVKRYGFDEFMAEEPTSDVSQYLEMSSRPEPGMGGGFGGPPPFGFPPGGNGGMPPQPSFGGGPNAHYGHSHGGPPPGRMPPQRPPHGGYGGSYGGGPGVYEYGGDPRMHGAPGGHGGYAAHGEQNFAYQSGYEAQGGGAPPPPPPEDDGGESGMPPPPPPPDSDSGAPPLPPPDM